jgi:dienelactone hydrolase
MLMFKPIKITMAVGTLLTLGCAAAGQQGDIAAVPAAARVSAPTEMVRDIAIPRTGGSLAADVIYPKEGGPYPVIIFSHGAGGTPYAYRELTSAWAEAGFVVVAPTHGDARPLLRARGLEGRELMVELLRSAVDPASWERRVGDIKAIMDVLPKLASADQRLAGKVDPQRVGVGGHSYGAFTSMLVACAQPRSPAGGVVNHRDPRPRAFLLLSAQGPGQQGLHRDSWRSCDRPMMVMTGTEDRGRPRGDQPPQTWREKLLPYELSPPGGKVGVVLNGAAHSSFLASDRRAAAALGPAAEADQVDPALQVRIFNSLATQTTAWWRAHLYGDAASRAAIASGSLAREGGVTATYQVR